MPLVSDIDIKCCLSRTAAAVDKIKEVQESGVLSFGASPSSLTSGTPSDLPMGTIPAGTYILSAKGVFAMTGATSTDRSTSIRAGSNNLFTASNPGATTTYTGSETQDVSGIYTFTQDTALSLRVTATFSAGTMTGGGSLMAVRLY